MYQQVFQLHSELLKAMSHPKRLEIIHLLRDQELSVTDIQQMLGLPQANLSQHLQVLRESSIVKTRKNGKQIYYSLDNQNFIKASDLLRQVLVERHQDDDLSDEFSHKMSELVPLARDPVCGMRISPKTAAFAHTHQNNEYYFCASGCFNTFKKNPKKYSQKETSWIIKSF